MDRITEKMLQRRVDELNKLEGFERPKYSTVGSYVLDGAYGGVQLQQYVNECGGVTVISKGGYTTKRELYNQIACLLDFLYIKKMVNA